MFGDLKQWCAGASITMLACSVTNVLAAPITATSLYHFRNISLGLGPGIGDILVFGAFFVDPPPSAGTTGTFAQGASTGTLVGQPFNPSLLENSVPYDAALTGSWELTFRNGPDTTVVHTGSVGAGAPTPFARALSISGARNAPTLSWQLPGDPAQFSRQDVFVYTRRQERPESIQIIHAQEHIPLGINSYQIPEGIIESGQQYGLSVNLWNAAGNTRSFLGVDYSATGGAVSVDPVFLPSRTVNQDGRVVFEFQPIPVIRDIPIIIDPDVAIGYDYAVKTGDPFFQSVILPTDIGDGKYQLDYVYGGMAFSAALDGGIEYSFGDGGVAAFRVTGIEVSAALDPNDGGAFQTTVTFASDGVFAGTMTPITVAVPEPGTWSMLAMGIGMVGAVATGRRARQSRHN